MNENGTIVVKLETLDEWGLECHVEAGELVVDRSWGVDDPQGCAEAIFSPWMVELLDGK